MAPFTSYAQNGEDVRVWHAFGPKAPSEECPVLTYVEVGANDPRDLSVTAALYDLGWSGLLIEPDPVLVKEIRMVRPRDQVAEVLAADSDGERVFYRIPGTGLSTLDKGEARAAFARGFIVEETKAIARTLDSILEEFLPEMNGLCPPIHFMSIDVEGAEQQVLSGLRLTKYRPWVLCIEGVEPGTNNPSFEHWDSYVLERHYRFIAFDGINRWYVAAEHADDLVSSQSGAAAGTTIAHAISTPFHALDAGMFGWRTSQVAKLDEIRGRNESRHAWQRELILHEAKHSASIHDYEMRLNELQQALTIVERSRTFTLSRYLARFGKRVVHLLRSLKHHLPEPINALLIRQRHLNHVTVNMKHITDPAFLQSVGFLDPVWLASIPKDISMQGSALPIPPGLGTSGLTESEVEDIQRWLAEYPYDRDSDLHSRMDNHDDEVGRTRAALRSRLRIAVGPTNPHWAGGNKVAIDVRALQAPAFGNRGIGRFAKSVLAGVREVLEDERITLIVDLGLNPLPLELVGNCHQVTSISEREVAQYSVLIQPSPMTHTPEPFIALLHSSAFKLAVVFDFIPLHYPTIYLNNVAARAEYARNLDALKCYDDFVCISRTVRRELASTLGLPQSGPNALEAVVAWPREISETAKKMQTPEGRNADAPIVLLSGDEPRKNTFGGLAGIAAATATQESRDVIVVGMAGQETRVHHWSIAAGMRPGEAKTPGRVSDSELSELLASAACVVVPSFDEGLSLPVIEAVHAGTPVVVSGIKSHRELVGTGRFTFNPSSPRSIARAIRRSAGKRGIFRRQRRRLAAHPHASVEAAVGKRILDRVRPALVQPPAPARVAGARLSVGVATPWTPQRSGVADFSTEVFTELARFVDVTVYTTADAMVTESNSPQMTLIQRSVDEVLAEPEKVKLRHDAFITVVGNSHYHLPFIQLMQQINPITIAHDTRMVEFYLALRGRGGVEQLMLATADGSAASLIPPLDEQIDDMRLLQNSGFWEIAQRSRRLIMHSPSAAPMIAQQTGIPIHLLPFANQRVPEPTTLTPQDRMAARERLGLNEFPPEVIHLGSFGYVDARTKLSDVVIEAAAWLNHWGHPVALHFVGSGSETETSQMQARAQDAGIPHFEITGFQSEEAYCDWLLAVDLGIQLRVSPLLGVSGPLSDLAAFGTPGVASAGLCIDVDTPAYIHRLPDAVSPVTVAEAVENILRQPMDVNDVEALRRSYVAEKSSQRYAEMLLNLVKEDLS